jgi:hypothetical protein
MGPFFESLWQGESIGDGADVGEALLAYRAVRPGEDEWDGNWQALLSSASFEAFLDNADALERIPVSAAMIATALAHER